VDPIEQLLTLVEAVEVALERLAVTEVLVRLEQVELVLPRQYLELLLLTQVVVVVEERFLGQLVVLVAQVVAVLVGRQEQGLRVQQILAAAAVAEQILEQGLLVEMVVLVSSLLLTQALNEAQVARLHPPVVTQFIHSHLLAHTRHKGKQWHTLQK
jgi:hypothetical protein